MTFADGTRLTPGTERCKCGPTCEHPCWLRIGVTSRPCCPDCPPLPLVDEPPSSPAANPAPCDCPDPEIGHTTHCTGGW